jgi:hypothetical protein
MSTALRNAARAKPLVLLEDADAAVLVQSRQITLPEDLAGLPAAHRQPEACLLAALAADRPGEAALLLGGFLRRRISALWAWWCVHQTLAAATAQAAAAAAAGAPARPPAPTRGIGMSAADFAPPPPPPGTADPAAWPVPAVQDGRLVWLPPALQDDPARPPSLAERWFARKQEHLASLTPERRAAVERSLAAGRERLLAAFGGPPREVFNSLLRQRVQASQAASEAAHEPFARLQGALAAKRGEVEAQVAGVHARLAEMKAAMPRRAPPRDDPSSPHAQAALEAARRWLIAPGDDAAWAAFKSGEACSGREQPAGMVAMACYWSGTNLQPPEAGPDAQPVPPPPALAPRAVASALALARHLPGSGRSPDEWLHQYLLWGIEAAQGLLTIDRLLHLGGAPASPWAGKPGFGRHHARPS